MFTRDRITIVSEIFDSVSLGKFYEHVNAICDTMSENYGEVVYLTQDQFPDSFVDDAFWSIASKTSSTCELHDISGHMITNGDHYGLIAISTIRLGVVKIALSLHERYDLEVAAVLRMKGLV